MKPHLKDRKTKKNRKADYMMKCPKQRCRADVDWYWKHGYERTKSWFHLGPVELCMEFIVLALRVCTCRWRAKNDWPTVLLARRSSAACRCNCMPYKKSENEMCSCFTLLLISILFCCIFLLFLSLCFVCCKSVILRHLEFCNCLLCKKNRLLVLLKDFNSTCLLYCWLPIV